MRKFNLISTAIYSSYLISVVAHANSVQNGVLTEDGLDVIEVVARKQVESLQDIPMSIQAIDGEKLNQLSIHDLNDLSLHVPGLEQPNIGIQSRIILRGLSSGDNAAFEQAIGTYVDGVYRGRMNQVRAGLFDMEHIEVLKGPQVSLYGNSSIGGAISMFATRPDNDLSGYAAIKYEMEFQEKQLQAALNVPIGDELSARLAVKFRKMDDGLLINEFNQEFEPRQEDNAFRLSLNWQLDEWSAYFRHEQGDFETVGSERKFYKHVDADNKPWPSSPYHSDKEGGLNVGNSKPFISPDTFWQTENEESMLELKYKKDKMEFVSITADSRYDFKQSMDVDFVPVSLIGIVQDEAYSQFSQELRWLNHFSDDVNLLLGAYYQKSDFRNDYYADFNTPVLLSGMVGLPLDLTNMLISPFSRHTVLDQETKTSALFSHVNWRLSSLWSISLGTRWTQIKKNAVQSVSLANIQHQPGFGELIDSRWLSPELAPLLLAEPDYLANRNEYVLESEAGSIAPVLVPDHALSYSILSASLGQPHSFNDLERDEEHLMFNLSFNFDLTDDWMTYLAWSQGAKAGGFDFLYEGNDRAGVEYEDESANVFELGSKQQGKDWRLNLALFHSEYDDLQVSIFNGFGFDVGNAASAHSDGLELDFVYKLNADLSINSNLQWLNFQYDNYANAACSSSEKLTTGQSLCDWSGRNSPFVPKLAAVVTLDYFANIAGLDSQHLLSLSYKSKHTTASDNEALTIQNAYSLLDYRSSLSFTDDLSASLLVKNILDKDYNASTGTIPLAVGGAFVHEINPGRQVYLELAYQF